MPKLIIKRELPRRFTRQAILFWVLGLLPVALLAGFLTGTVITQLQHNQFKAGQIPLLPLAPTLPPQQILPNSQAPKLSLPINVEKPTDTKTVSPIFSTNTDSNELKPLFNSQTPSKLQTAPVEIPVFTNSHNKSLNSSIKRPDTNNQNNPRKHPIATPRVSNKPLKSPQIVSESPRITKSVNRIKSEAHIRKAAKAQAAVPPDRERGNNHDYRLLEQSLGISLQ